MKHGIIIHPLDIDVLAHTHVHTYIHTYIHTVSHRYMYEHIHPTNALYEHEKYRNVPLFASVA